VTTADGQAIMLDQRFFHGSVKGGFFIGSTVCINIFFYFTLTIRNNIPVKCSYLFLNFLEAGAHDGERGSPSLYYEIK
jgi:hypothetical protein